MPATRSYEAIMKEVEDYLVKLEDEWARVQTKRMKHKKEKVRKKMKERMDLILRVNMKLQKCKQSLQALHLVHGNSVEWQRGKEEMETRLSDIQIHSLTVSVNFNFFSKGVSFRGRTPPHLSKVNDYTELHLLCTKGKTRDIR